MLNLVALKVTTGLGRLKEYRLCLYILFCEEYKSRISLIENVIRIKMAGA
jgi:hypothetical protein